MSACPVPGFSGVDLTFKSDCKHEAVKNGHGVIGAGMLHDLKNTARYGVLRRAFVTRIAMEVCQSKMS